MVQTPAWLRYANQGATRNLPLSPQLQTAFGGFLPQMGVSMEVFSGGQPAKGSGGSRVGSVRHDHGNAADVFFYKDGRRLDWANPNDLPIFQDIVRQGKQAGITGFGAGQGYMQPGSMHVGFGTPGVWGAGGSGKNAPSWLTEAYGGAGSQVAAQSSSQQNGTPAKPTESSLTVGEPQSAGIMSAFAATPTRQPPSFIGGVDQIKNGNYLDGAGQMFGSMAAGGGQQQIPQTPAMQLAPVQGPSSQQATALANYVQSLLGKKVSNG
ncbi:hypothetical protein [Paenochrobactrum glaciei]|uniref:Uncharacterized protein n=2 Tax=Paenochrobactrum glaciei TaxID=486407 RepID=A0ABN1GK95_9HYPH